jgi:cellulase
VNNPVLSVTGDSIVCDMGLKELVSSAVVTIPAGAKVGAWYEPVLGGPQIPNDADNPIAKSHKGPFMACLAKVCSEVVVVRREVLTKTQVDNTGTAG